MRCSILVLSLFPTALLAETYQLESEVTAATLYPQGATILREVPFEIPAGQHEFVIGDLPRSTPVQSLRVDLEGAALGAVTTRRDFVPPRDAETSAGIAAAAAEVARLEGDLRAAEGGIAETRLEIDAAQARIAFLETLGTGETTAGKDAAALRELARMIGEETLEARRSAHQAQQRAEAADRALKGLRDELDKARRALAALETEDTDYAMLTVAASADEPVQGVLRISYLYEEAGWQPTYDMRLDKRRGALEITRGALVAQNTGENWEDVRLTLSTVRPSEQIEPREVFAWQRRVIDPPEPMPRASVQYEADGLSESRSQEAPLMEPANAKSAEAVPSYDGLAVSYDYPEPVSIANAADALRITLGTVETDAQVRAFAAPLYDETGFMMASITNDMGELILPSGHVNLFVDGRFAGASRLGEVIPVGGEADIAFGAIDGLRLARTVTRNEGDRGMISRSSELSEAVSIEVENLTGESWPVKLFDRVPYSEQEALEIDWRAEPSPSEEDVDGRQGVLAWEFELGAGETRAITLSYELEWPEGKVLR